MKRTLTLFAAFLLFPTTNLHAADAPAKKPNIIIILSDDYGYGSAGCYGADPALVKTPNIDRLATEGRRFTDANTTSSVCSPTRYSVLTGRYCWRTSLKHEVLNTFAPLHIETTRLNMASLLKKHGYSTASVGKWHLGYGTADDSPRWRADYTAELSPGPLDIGFDYHFSVPSNHGDVTGVFVENRYVYGLRQGKIPPNMKLPGPVADSDDFQPTYTAQDMENPKNGAKILDIDAPRRKNERVMKVLTDKATKWIEQQPKDKPFFLYFTPVAVHNPVTPDADLAGKSAAGRFGDWIHELDRSVGRVLDTLDRQGVANDTLVIFSSDNGGVFVPKNEKLLQTQAFKAGLRVNGDLRGGKHDVWEGGFKVPFLVRWRGHAAKGSVCKEMISLADLLATTAAIVGEPLPEASKAAEDSHNFLPAILGDSPKPIRDDMIVHSADGVFAIRKGPWKWIEGVPVDEVSVAARKAHADQHRPQLYNTHDDPAETKDVSAEHPEVVKELTALLNRYRNGGYSRELPPEKAIKESPVAVLPPVQGKIVIHENFAQMPAKPWAVSRGDWQVKDSALWAAQKPNDEQGAALRTPCLLGDGTVDFELNLNGANRISLRIEAGDPNHTFRVVVARNSVEITKNPSRGENAEAAEDLARKPLSLAKGRWYPVRLTFKGSGITVQVNDTLARATHAIFAKQKTGINFLVFGDAAGFRNVNVASDAPEKSNAAEPVKGMIESLSGKKVVFLGDSITQSGVYVSLTSYYLNKLHPHKNFDIFGLGLSSETLSGLSEPNHAGGAFPRPCLFERLGRLLERVKPDVVFACYGMNDGIYLPLDEERFGAFKKGVEKLVKDCQTAGVTEIFLITPPIFDAATKKDEFNYDSVLTEFAAWETSLKTSGLHVIDLHTQMRRARDSRHEVFSKDRVHPGDEGHLLMAKTILAALGQQVPDDSLETIKADPLYKQVDQLRRHRSTHWMQHIGFTREKKVEPKPLGDTETEAAKMQEKIDELRRGK